MSVHYIREDVHEEGSYSALVRVFGQEFAVHYVAGEIRVYGTAGQRGARRWQVKSAADTVRASCAGRIQALGSKFAAAHRALYAPDDAPAPEGTLPILAASRSIIADRLRAAGEMREEGARMASAGTLHEALCRVMWARTLRLQGVETGVAEGPMHELGRRLWNRHCEDMLNNFNWPGSRHHY